MSETTDWTAEDEAELDEIVRRIQAGKCPQCSATPEYVRQVHQAMYAHPCGHRMGVGNARKNNAHYGRTAPESVHADPDCGLYSEWVD